MTRCTALVALLALLAPASAHEHAYETDALRVPRLRTGGSCVIRGATIHSAVAEPRTGDVLIVDGRIEAIGAVEAPEGLVEIDGAGRHLAPGAVDCHSHMAISGGLNESTVSISAEVRVADALDADDIAIYRALAGGTTTVHLLHGSANAIGGQDAVLKLRWGRRASELRFPDAPRGIKLALGENPRRANDAGEPERFPATRMGVAAVLERAFEAARAYQAEWADHGAAVERGEAPVPPRRDLRLEALSEVLNGGLAVHCHCYRADGILMLLRTAERFGFRVATLQHALEAHKIAFEIAQAGAGVSTFADWWSYKVEAYDAVPQNAAFLDAAGVLTSLGSDSDEVARRLYGEAAKSVRYAGMDPVRALALVTLDPARQLGIDGQVGSVEVGKQADLVLFTGEPLSSLARVEWTMVDGEIEYQRRDAFGLDDQPLSPRALERKPRGPLAHDPQGGEVWAIRGATLHTAVGPPVENGTLVFQDGRILELGVDIAIPAAAQVVEAQGRHVWPGMIALNTTLGLREIASVAATVDTSEIGGSQPDLRAASSVNAGSAHLAVTRSNGVTRAETAPRGAGPVRGQSALLDLAGSTWEGLVQLDAALLHVAVPELPNVVRGELEEPVELAELRRLFARAREHGALIAAAVETGGPGPAHDARLAALAPYARGERRVALHAANAQTILAALRFAREAELDAVLFGALEGWKVAEELAASGLPVVVGPVLALPRSRYDPCEAPYANAAVLLRAGVEVAIQSADDENPRNLPFHAAMAAAHGLPPQEALRAITLTPARILGVEDELGSLEPGKIADLVVTDGDLLEVASPVRRVFIDGRPVDLQDRQQRLYEQSVERLERLRGDDGPR